VPALTTTSGIALHDQKKLDEAIAAYHKAIEIDPKDAWLETSAAFMRDLRDYDEASCASARPTNWIERPRVTSISATPCA
jgi:tetratricopeptide (TPR) repeat protein